MWQLIPVMVMMFASSIACPAAGDSYRVLLWDFEDGIGEWWANPWSGGEAGVEAGDGRYGKGLKGFWKDVPQRGNLVSPFVDEDAAWRDENWQRISLWFRGDGTNTRAKITVQTRTPDGKLLSHSKPLPMDSANWRRFSFDLRTFWNRQKVPIDAGRVARIMIAAGGTHECAIDHIALQAPRMALPLDEVKAATTELQPSAFRTEDNHLLTVIDPAQLHSATKVTATATFADGRSVSTERQIAQTPQDDIRLGLEIPQAAEDKFDLSLSACGDERPVRNWRYSTYMAARQPLSEVPDEIDLLPAPKQTELKHGKNKFVPAASPELTVYGSGSGVEATVRYVAKQLKGRAGIECELEFPDDDDDNERLRLVVGEETGADVGAMPWEKIAEHGPEAYAVAVDGNGMIVAATDKSGLRNGAMTILQLVLSGVGNRSSEGIPALEILDWPTLPVRGITIPLPTKRWGHPIDAPVDAEYWRRFMLRTCLEHKLNTIVLLVRQGMEYERHPEIGGPAAWSQQTVRDLVDTFKDYGIQVIPLLDSLGHANWLVIPIKRLREDKDTHTLCTRHPDSKRILLDCYEECIEVFKPTYFHTGLDEIRWKTFQKPQEQRCDYCRGIDKRKIFLDQVNMLHGFLTERGITPMMWGDMLLKKHNGGPPFHLDGTLPQLPKDIVITNWSTSLDPLSNHFFDRLGFPVIQSNSRGVSPAQIPWVRGNFFGVWKKHPWLMDGAAGRRRAVSYSYLSMLCAAEYSWNAYPDPMAVRVELEREVFADRLRQLTRLAVSAPPGTMQPLEIETAGGRLIDGAAGRCRFAVADKAMQPSIEKPLTVPVGKRMSAAYLLVGVEVNEEKRETFAKLFQKKNAWAGVAIGELTLNFADGTQAQRSLMHGVDVVDTTKRELPFTYNAIDYWREPKGRIWAVVQWPNPHPEKRVEKLVFSHAGTAAQPMLKAASIESIDN